MGMVVWIVFPDGGGRPRGMNPLSGGDCRRHGGRAQERFLEGDENRYNLRLFE